MKKIILLAAMVLGSSAAFAQKNNVAYDANEAWFINAGVGANLTVLGVSNGLKFGGVATELDLAAGKWIIPSVGLRVGYSGLAYDNNFGADQTDKIGFFHADLMVDPVSYFLGYNSERFYTPQPYVTTGIVQCWSNNATDFAAGVGLFNSFRISEKFDINADFRATVYKNNYLQSLGNYSPDAVISATVGLSYKFGRQNEANRKAAAAAAAAAATIAAQERNIADLKDQVADANDEAAAAKKAAAAAKKQAAAAKKANKPATASKPAASSKSVAATSSNVADVKPVVVFDLSSCEINEASKVTIGFWAETIKANPNQKYTLVGYADNTTGSAAINEKISKKRAEAVADVLVNTYGVDESQISVDYKGGVDLKIDGITGSSRVVVLE